MAVADVHVRSWQVAYRGLLADAYLDGLRPEDRASRYVFDRSAAEGPETLLACEERTIRGFAATGHARDEDGGETGELLALYVDPDHWGRGIGRLLLVEARERLTGRGFLAAVLWVLAGNERAERFYRADGWAPDGVSRREEVWGVAVDQTRYRRALP
jgi:GNAT superfamily N-acetyltransferase